MLRKRQKCDSNSVINRLRIEPEAKSRFSIPLCRLHTLLLVRPINEVDVQRLENKFVTGYRDSDRVLYVATRRRHLMSRATCMIPGAAFGSPPMTALRPSLWLILTLPDFLARCSTCGRETIELWRGGVM